MTNASDRSLPFFDVVQSDRFIAAKIVPQQNLSIPTFAFQDSLSSLTQSEPAWPNSTERLNTLRLAIKYRPDSGIRAKLNDTSTLIVDLIDYPGEWLLDLPMLEQDYFSWSKKQLELLTSEPRKSAAAPFIKKLAEFEWTASVDESALKQLAHEYKSLLLYFKNELKLTELQPGRLLMPADLEDAPVTLFFPTTQTEQNNDIENTNLGQLIERFSSYQNTVIKPFYKTYFCDFDRQIILVDLLNALHGGPVVLNEQNRVIAELLSYFDYGQSGFLKRLFSPNIDRLLFAANKSDHVSVEHHKDLALLLSNLVKEAKNDLHFAGVKVETMAMSSVCATKNVSVMQDGEKLNCIYGREIKSGDFITYLPTQPPMRPIKAERWPESGFVFPEFYPYPNENDQLRHIRLDHVMEFLLGDKLQ